MRKKFVLTLSALLCSRPRASAFRPMNSWATFQSIALRKAEFLREAGGQSQAEAGERSTSGQSPGLRSRFPAATQFLGSADRFFEVRKVWLANLPTAMIRRNENTRAPELRLYSYIPAFKRDAD